MKIENVTRLDALIEPMLQAARVPGAALAIVAGGETIFAKGYGHRDLQATLPMTADTLYPIASTTKAINATLLGMLVDAGQLAWDRPVQEYLPSFRLIDPLVSATVTLRDLIIMRTGLPRHDWCWLGHPVGRADLVNRLRFLEPSAEFRERFQYNNLTATTAGHLAEVVTGQPWEALVRNRILEPLGMDSSVFAACERAAATSGYYETAARTLVPTPRLSAEVTAPSGGSLHSTVRDMARWITFNLARGKWEGSQLISTQTIEEILSPQIVVGKDPAGPTPGSTYGMGWFIDRYNGCARTSHGGYLHDVNSEVTLFPEQGIGIVSTTNFGCPRLARLINQQAFDLLRGVQPTQTLQAKLAQYEASIEEVRNNNAAAHARTGTVPTHDLDEYAGRYTHGAYGTIEIRRDAQGLFLRREDLAIELQHWHYDAWVIGNDAMFATNEPHPFDRTNPVLFAMDATGRVGSVNIRFEPAVAAIRFEKLRD